MNIRSEERLATCDKRLQRITERADKRMPLVVIGGERDREQQRQNIINGVSWTMDSLHLRRPSLAVDLAPKPIDWKNISAFFKLKEIMFEEAAADGVTLRWGADWNMNGRTERGENDYGHYEIYE